MDRVAITAVFLTVGVATIVIGLGAGQLSLGPQPLETLRRQLQQVHTVAQTFVGRVHEHRHSVLVLHDAAVVTPFPSPDAESKGYAVERHTGEPYGLGGAILILDGQVAFIADVTPALGFAEAYGQGRAGSAHPEPSP